MREIDEIFQEMRSGLERKTGVSINPGGDMALRLHALAAELSTLWAQVEWTRAQSFPQTAVGESLALHAVARGLTRGSSTAASGLIRFETDMARSVVLPIPKGTVCLNAAGVEFLTTEYAEISAGELFCDVQATAREAGVFGNVPPESVIFMAHAPVGVVRCFNPGPFQGGTEKESDQSLRERVIATFASLPNGSNVAFYRSVALNTEGVAAVHVEPRARGLGTVDVIIAGDGGLPSDELVALVEAKLAEQREISVDVRVFAPDVVNVPVSFAIDVCRGFDFAEVADELRQSLWRYFNGTMLGRDVLLAKLGNVAFGVRGLANYRILQPVDDLVITFKQLPVIGEISVVRR